LTGYRKRVSYRRKSFQLVELFLTQNAISVDAASECSRAHVSASSSGSRRKRTTALSEFTPVIDMIVASPICGPKRIFSEARALTSAIDAIAANNNRSMITASNSTFARCSKTRRKAYARSRRTSYLDRLLQASFYWEAASPRPGPVITAPLLTTLTFTSLAAPLWRRRRDRSIGREMPT
jgi:hypothetical protein